MKTKDVESRFEGCANKREVLDAIEEMIIEQLEEYNPRVYEYLEQRTADCPNLVVTIEARYQNCQNKKNGVIFNRFIGYDVKVEEK